MSLTVERSRDNAIRIRKNALRDSDELRRIAYQRGYSARTRTLHCARLDYNGAPRHGLR